MEITLTLNGKKLTRSVEADTILLDFLRNEGCYSVKRGCDTTNCGLCTVFMDDIKLQRWKACKKRLPNLAHLLLTRVQSNAASAIPV